MFKSNTLSRLFISFTMLLITTNVLHAETQPKFTIIPTTPTTLAVQFNQVATIQYLLTNQTKVTRTLNISIPSIRGVTQTSNIGDCTNPVTLAPHQSCNLTLKVVGLILPVGVNSGAIKVCKTKGAGDYSPDPFLCSQTSQSNELHVTRQAVVRVTASPNVLTLNANTQAPGQLTITNLSTTVTATNVHANLTKSTLKDYVTQDASNCASIPAGKSCVLIFTPTTAQAVSQTFFPIQGDNTIPTTGSIQISALATASINVPDNYLILTTPNSLGTMTVQNKSTTVTATGITAFLNTQLIAAGVRVDETIGCPVETVAPQTSCLLTFRLTNGTTLSGQSIVIAGTNTSIANATIEIDASTPGAPQIAFVGSSDLFFPYGSAPQSVTIQNTSGSPVSNIQAYLPSSLEGSVYIQSNTCIGSLTNGSTCSITFALYPDASTLIPAQSVPIYGDNSNTILANIAVGSNYFFTATVSGDLPAIVQCAINPLTSLLTSCGKILSNSSYLTYPAQLAVDSVNNDIYISNSLNADASNSSFVSRCPFDSSNASIDTSKCKTTGSYTVPFGIALNSDSSRLYITSGLLVNPSNDAYFCADPSTSNFTSCDRTNEIASVDLSTYENYSVAINLSATYSYAYFVSGYQTNKIGLCPIKNNGTLDICELSIGILGNQTDADNYTIVVSPKPANTYAYVTNFHTGKVYVCNIDSFGKIPTCSDTFVPLVGSSTHVSGMTINSLGTKAYIVQTTPGLVNICDINSGTGALGPCLDAGMSSSLLGDFSGAAALWEPPT